MGCDIHFYVEKKDGDQWVSADTWTPDKYADEPGALTVDYDDRFYSGRSYNLFAILADVRNGRGFAGVKTGEGFNPISEPRGLPSDVSKIIAKESDDYGIDGHSHSYFTVTELLAYDWTQQAQCQGMVNGPQAEEWLRRKPLTSAPENFCGGISGSGIKKISMYDMEQAINALKSQCVRFDNSVDWDRFSEAVKATLSNTYALAIWHSSYATCCKWFWFETIPRLLQVGPIDDVRIVFWFDN